MAWYNDVGNFLFGGGADAHLPYFEEDRNRLGQQLDGRSQFVGEDPYAGDYRALIDQLRAQSEGRGPSLAEQQYRRASGDNMAQQAALARGGRSLGAGRQAAQNMGSISQGLASGVAEARTREQLGAQQALNSVIGGASQSTFARDQLNSQAYMQTLAAQLGLSVSELNALMGNAQSNSQGAIGTLGAAATGIGGLFSGGARMAQPQGSGAGMNPGGYAPGWNYNA